MAVNTDLTGGRHRARAWVAAAVIVGAGLIAYHNILTAPFVFDDAASIEKNPSIRHLSALGQVLSPPAADGRGVAGRPLVNLSLALNYAAGGLDVRGYHAANLAFHLLAALALFGLVRRTLRDLPAACVIALLWAVHPLQTEAVTCVIQRTESLMGLFFLLTLYCFSRFADGRPASASREEPARPGAGRWGGLSILCCLAGMATKEVMVSAPVLVLLYDRTFLAGSFGEAWRRRKAYYLGLAATWFLLLFLVLRGGGSRSSAAGFGQGVSPWHYLLTQCWALPHYLRLAVWPHPLIVDYGTAVVTQPLAVLPQGLLVLALLGGTITALFARGPARVAGFLGAWFFAILAPSSSVVPLVTQTVAEHRMYLPLAALMVGAVLILRRYSGRAFFAVGLGLATALTAATVRRNQDYRSAVALWRDTVAHRPENLRARDSLGYALAEAGEPAAAAAVFTETLRRDPAFGEAHYGLASALRQSGRLAEAIAQYEEALRFAPGYPNAHYSLGVALGEAGQGEAAVAQYQEALRLQPDYPEARNGLGVALATLGRGAEALAEFQEALRLDPDSVPARVNLGNLYLGAGRADEAMIYYRQALALQPTAVEAHNYLGVALAHAGRGTEAMVEYQAALRFKPDYPEARVNLGNLLQAAGRLPEAVAQYQEAIRLEPGLADAHENLGVALQALGRNDEAEAEYAKAARLEAGPRRNR
jgi:tetratricopeptide (TPR) repeat protein